MLRAHGFQQLTEEPGDRKFVRRIRLIGSPHRLWPRVPAVYLTWVNPVFLAFFAFNGTSNLRAFNVAFSSIPTAPLTVLGTLLRVTGPILVGGRVRKCRLYGLATADAGGGAATRWNSFRVGDQSCRIVGSCVGMIASYAGIWASL